MMEGGLNHEKMDGVEATDHVASHEVVGTPRNEDSKSNDDYQYDFDKFIELAEKEEGELEEDTYYSSDGYYENLSPIVVDLTNEFQSLEIFTTLEDATSWLQDKGRALGFVFVKIRSRLKKSVPNIDFGCDKGGEFKPYKNKEPEGSAKYRDTFTKKCGCPFKLKCKYVREGDFWVFEIGNGGHNHLPYSYDTGQAYLGRLTPEEEKIVWEMTESDVKPASILKTLKKRNSKNCTVPKGIYNARSKMKRKRMEGRSVVQEVFHLAEQSNTFIRHTRLDGCIENVFWSFADANSLANQFPKVFIMDCTYKTNRYKLPLLHIVGVTSTMQSFAAGFALLSGEKQANFEWALEMFRDSLGEIKPSVLITDREKALMNVIPKIFPDAKTLLCQWHIAKGVSSVVMKQIPSGDSHEKECKKVMEKWLEITSCKSGNELKKVMEECKSWIHPHILDYMESIWLTPHKELFLSGWADEIMHLGNTCTSRVEGMHSVLKNWLKTCNVDLVTSWEACTNMSNQQVDNIKASLQKSLSKRSTKSGISSWASGLTGRVSIPALQLIDKEMLRMQWVGTDVSKCRCKLRKVYGLPCAHELNLIFHSRTYIKLEEIDSHWKTLSIKGSTSDDDDVQVWNGLRALLDEKFIKSSGLARRRLIDRLREMVIPSTTILQEPPTKLKIRGRPKGSKNKARQQHEQSTKRDPSLFEIIESQSSIKNSQASVKKSQAEVSNAQVEVPNSEVEVTNPQVVKKRGRKRKIKEAVTWDCDGLGEDLPFVPRTELSPVVSLRYLEQIPESMRPYIESVVDVKGDGNCGYRALAVQLGLGEESWSDVRKTLWDELNANYKDYERLMLHPNEAKNVKHNLLWPKQNGGCRKEKWMDMPNCLWVVAQRYNAAVSILSCKSGGSLTCFPYRTGPYSNSPRHYWLMFIDENHYVSVDMFPECPLPPIQHGWERNCRGEARSWKNLFRSRLEEGTRLVYLADEDPKQYDVPDGNDDAPT